MKIKVKENPEELRIDIDRNEFALELKTWRLRQNLTQKEVGKRWGCDRFTIMRAEAAKPISWQMAYRLFNHLSKELRDEIHDDNRHQ